MINGYFMRVVAYQLTQNKKYKLAVRSANRDYNIIIVEDIHGLKDALQDVHIVEGSDIDALTVYMSQNYDWSEPV